MHRINSRRMPDTIILIAITALTRFVFRTHYLYDIDSVNFALALKRFDPSAHQPHPPGYFLYVYLGRLTDLFFNDANAALVTISIFFSCGAVGAIYALADDWFGRNAALLAGLIFIFSPLAWFHGTVALTYIVEAFFSALTGYLFWRIYGGSHPLIPVGGIVLGVAAGFRPSSLMLLVPLFLFALLNGASLRQAAGGIGVLTLTLLAWLIPMLRISGGRAYLSSLASLWRIVPSSQMVFNSSLLNSVARALVILGIYFLCFGCAATLPIMTRWGNPSPDRRKRTFTWVWIAPGLLFFTFIFLKFVNSGYLLALAPPVCAWMGLWASRWLSQLRLSKALRVLTVGACATLNTLIFIFAPVYCSYAAVLRFERELEGIMRTLPEVASPHNSVIVAFDSHFLGYRHAGYYFPDYLTVQFPEVQLASGKRVFAMQYRDTHLATGLPRTAARDFIMFPLPLEDGESNRYMESIRKRFPPGELRRIARGDEDFEVGAIEDLRVLFPVSAHADAASVSER